MFILKIFSFKKKGLDKLESLKLKSKILI